MKNIRDELQNIIIGDGSIGKTSQLKKTQNFLRANAGSGLRIEEQKHFKRKEEIKLIDFAKRENLFYPEEISENDYISSGAEQRVYRYDDYSVIKLNDSVFYECWLDYFNSLLIHNYFFQSTAYNFLGFKLIDNQLFAVVKQDFILANEVTDLAAVKVFLSFNDFENNRNHDYINKNLGIIFEYLHDENVLSNNGLIYFIDTIFYLTEEFYF